MNTQPTAKTLHALRCQLIARAYQRAKRRAFAKKLAALKIVERAA